MLIADREHSSEISLYRDDVSHVLYVATSSHSYECRGVLHRIKELGLVILITRVSLLRPLHTYGNKHSYLNVHNIENNLDLT